MKLDNVPDLYFVITILVPGFIYHGVLSKFVPLRQHNTKEVMILSFLTATAFNYAICSPFIYLLITNHLFSESPKSQAVTLLIVILVVPIFLALISARVTQTNGFGWLYGLLRLRPINPIPTGWDWIFSRTEPCFVIVTLNGGTEIAGYFGRNSMASSDPDRRDLYLERVYVIPADKNQAWELVQRSGGMYIGGSAISFVEFRNEAVDD